jgi:hypothetical protein
MDVCLLWILYVVRSLWRADYSSSGVLPTVVRCCMCSRNLKNEEAMARVGSQRQRGEKYTRTDVHTIFPVSRFVWIVHFFFHLIFPTCFSLYINIYLNCFILWYYYSRFSSCVLFFHAYVTIYYLEIFPAIFVFHYIAVGLVYEPHLHHRYMRSISSFLAFLLLHLSFHIKNIKDAKPIISFELRYIF